MATFFSWMISPFAAMSLSLVLRFVRFSSCLQAWIRPLSSLDYKIGLRGSAVLATDGTLQVESVHTYVLSPRRLGITDTDSIIMHPDHLLSEY